MKNINVLLAKSYIKSFYETLALSVPQKELKELQKKVNKYEDVSYIKDVLNDEIKNNIIQKYLSNKDQNIEIYESLIKELDGFYNDNLLNKEIIDVQITKKALNKVNESINNAIRNEYLIDINQLCDLKNNIDVEINVYVAKHKSDEYMDMDVFHKSITNTINEGKSVLKNLIENNKMKEEDYYEAYIAFVYTRFNILFENAGNKVHTLPKWAKGLLFCTPWIIGFLAFTLYPLIQTFIFSFSTVRIPPYLI